MVNEKIVEFRIKPYIQEATLQIIFDIVILAIASALLIFVGFPLFVCVAIIVCYFAIALILHYRVIIQAIIDKQKTDYITEIVSIKEFIEEYSFAGDRMGHSNLRFFYPKELNVCKYKIKVIRNNSVENKLRSVISFKRLLKFMMLDKLQIEYMQVTYLKRSKILLCVDLVEGSIKSSNKKKKDIEKAVYFINKSI